MTRSLVTGSLAALVALIAPASPARGDCTDPLRDPDQVLDFNLRMSRATWQQLIDDVIGDGCEAQYPERQVEFRCGDDEAWITIAARHKRGDQRGVYATGKPPLKLDFNQFVPGQRWPTALGERGFRKLSLNIGSTDGGASYLSALLTEHLSWRLMHAEVPTASRSAYARLTVHFTDDGASAYHGLYIVLEDLDRTAIETRYGDGDGRLLKTTTGACRNEIVYDDGAPNAGLAGFDAWNALDPDGFPGTWAARTDQAIDLQEVLRNEAVRDVLGNQRDTMMGPNNSNFYSYDAVMGRRHYLPWDLDDMLSPHPESTPPDDPLEPACSAVGQKLRCQPEIRARYDEIACQLVNGTLHQDELLSDFAALHDLLAPFVEQERGMWDVDPLDAAVLGTYAYQIDYLRDWIPDRIASVRAELDCPAACTEGESEPCSYLTCDGERRCEGGRWTTCEVDPSSEQTGCGFGVGGDEGEGDGGDGGGGGDGDDGDDDDLTSGCAATDRGSSLGLAFVLLAGALVTRRARRRPPVSGR